MSIDLENVIDGIENNIKISTAKSSQLTRQSNLIHITEVNSIEDKNSGASFMSDVEGEVFKHEIDQSDREQSPVIVFNNYIKSKRNKTSDMNMTITNKVVNNINKYKLFNKTALESKSN